MGFVGDLVGDIFGGGGTEVEAARSPEQSQMFSALIPMLQRMGKMGAQGSPLFDAPSYDVPSTQGLMPTSGWFDSISPDVMQGVWEPYNQASQQMAEQMGAGGMGGSARGGWSGAAGAGLGKFWEQAGRNVGQQAWGMMQPGMAAGWNADLARNQNQAQMQYGALQAPYSAVGMTGQGLPNMIATQQPQGFSGAGAMGGALVGNELGLGGWGQAGMGLLGGLFK